MPWSSLGASSDLDILNSTTAANRIKTPITSSTGQVDSTLRSAPPVAAMQALELPVEEAGEAALRPARRLNRREHIIGDSVSATRPIP